MKHLTCTFFFCLIFSLVNAQSDSFVITFLPTITEFNNSSPYPIENGLIYNEQYWQRGPPSYVLANGWRSDTINGGSNRMLSLGSSYNIPYIFGSSHYFPYINGIRFEKNADTTKKAFRFRHGKLFTGLVVDTFISSFKSNYVQIVFSVNCIQGVPQGKGVLNGLLAQNGIIKKFPLSKCHFEKGEIVGVCKSWKLNTTDFEFNDEQIKVKNAEIDSATLIQELELTEVTYVKGSTDWLQKVIKNSNGTKKIVLPDTMPLKKN